jgi:hypothetical protein
MRAGVLRTHVEHHGVAFDGPAGNQVFQILQGNF